MPYEHRPDGTWVYSSDSSPHNLAVHESGHVVALLHAGIPVLRVQILPTQPQHLAETITSPRLVACPKDPDDLRRVILRDAATCAAGLAAEFLAAGGTPPIPDCMSNDQYGDCAEIIGRFAYLRATGVPGTLDEFAREAMQQAYDTLVAQRPALDRLTAALQRKLILEADEVNAIFAAGRLPGSSNRDP